MDITKKELQKSIRHLPNYIRKAIQKSKDQKHFKEEFKAIAEKVRKIRENAIEKEKQGEFQW